jgi:mRNA-degrading endonuclease toxin of MazEF toxin-antitoxin module
VKGLLINIREENYTGELWQLRSNAAQQEVSVLQARNSFQIAINELKNFLEYNGEMELETISTADYQDITSALGNWNIADLEEIENRLTSFAGSNNPDFLSQNLSVTISETLVKSAKANCSKAWGY